MERLISPHSQDPEEVVQRTTMRPLALNDFIGQGPLKKNLTIFIEATKRRGEALEHVLFYGPPGLGKTTLAQVVANELGVGFRSTSGPIISKAGDLAALLTNLQPHDVLFIDEIHRLNSSIEEVLYSAMEDRKLDLMIGEGPGARSVQIDLPPFTLIGATTRLGLISRPLRERFGIPLALNFYMAQELADIVGRMVGKLGLAIERDGAEEIGARARGTPRIALRLFRRVRDILMVEGHDRMNREMVDRALLQLDIDVRGFDAVDRRYLGVIAEHYRGGPVGVDTLAAILSEHRDVLEEVIEPYLIQQGFVHRTPRGRLLTKTAFAYMGLVAPENLDVLPVVDDE